MMKTIVIPPRLLEEWAKLSWENLERAEAEKRFLSRYSDGKLYIDAPPGYMLTRFDNPFRRDDLARCWACEPGIIRNNEEYQRRLYWLQNERWETGVYFGFRGIVFIKFKSANDIVRLRLYRLDGKRFGEYFAEGDEYIDLDAEGRQVVTVDPLPGALDIDPTEFWRGFDYQHAHGGRSRQQVEAAKRKRQQSTNSNKKGK